MRNRLPRGRSKAPSASPAAVVVSLVALALARRFDPGDAAGASAPSSSTAAAAAFGFGRGSILERRRRRGSPPGAGRRCPAPFGGVGGAIGGGRLYSSAVLTAAEDPQEASSSSSPSSSSAAPPSPRAPPPPPVPDKSTLLSSLNRLARLSSPLRPSAASEAQSLLDDAESWYRSATSDGRTVVVDAAVDGADSMEGVVIGPIPGVASYLSVMEAWTASGAEGRADRARELLRRMYELSDAAEGRGLAGHRTRKIRPNRAAYARVLAAYAEEGTTEAAEKAEALLEEMIEKSGLGGRSGAGEDVAGEGVAGVVAVGPENPLCRPDAGSFNLAMKAWSNAGGHGAGRRAEALLDRMWELRDAGPGGGGGPDGEDGPDDSLKPNHVSYTTAITAWARSGEGGRGARSGERLLEAMEELNRSGETSLKPTAFCVNAVLNAWAKSNKRGGADRAELILRRMEDLYLRGGRDELKPTAVSYNTVISAHARSGERGAERRAEAVLRRMDALSGHGTTTTTVRGRGFDGCAPDIVSYNSVINAWAKSAERNAARRAEAILRHMDRQFAAATSAAASAAAADDEKSDDDDGSEEDEASSAATATATPVAPDVTSYTSVVNAWARSGEEGIAAERADAVVRRMEEISRPGGPNPAARPNTLTYNSLLNAWAKSNDPRAGDRALEILERMERSAGDEDGGGEGGGDGGGAAPDVYTYTSAIDALARSDSPDAPDRAEHILEKMERAYKATGNTSIRPNVRTYTSVINVHARSQAGSPERAQAIVDRMEALSQSEDADKDDAANLRPDVVCYNALLNAWARSKGQPDKAFRARDVYSRMMDHHLSGRNPDAKPDLLSLNAVLSAAAFTDPTQLTDEDQRADVVDMCVRLMEELRDRSPEYGRPNPTTYATMLRAISVHLPPCDLRDELAGGVFEQCRDGGRVNGLVVSSLLRALGGGGGGRGGEGQGGGGKSLAEELLGDALLDETDEEGRRKFDVRRLPERWTRYGGGGGGGGNASGGGRSRGRPTSAKKKRQRAPDM